MQVARRSKDDFLVHVIAVDEDLGVWVGFADEDDDAVLQPHGQLDLVLDGTYDLRVALDDHVVGGLHVCNKVLGTAVELVEGVLELAHEGGVPTAQFLLDVGEYLI